MAVVAEHSTDGWAMDTWPGKWGTEALVLYPVPVGPGQVRPSTGLKGPTEGKAKPGMTFCWKERREGLRAHKSCQQTASRVRRVA